MKRSLVVTILILMVLSAGVAMPTRAQDGPETIKIGASIPLTGRYAGGGAQVERGYQIAVEDINAEGGVYVEEYDRQIPLELIVLDDESDPVKTVSNFEDLYSDEDVVAYLGGFGSDLHSAAAAVAEINGVPYLGVAFALWDVHQQEFEYLFSPFPKSPDLATLPFEMLDALVEEEERPTRVGIVQEQTDWGIELGEMWREQAEEYGYEVVAYEEYTPLTQDFTDLILRLQDADVEVLLSLPNPPDGITLISQMAELDFTPPFALLIRAPDAPTWVEATGVNGDYIMFSPGWHHAMDFPGVEELNEKHMELMERPADPIVGPSYALIQILAAAIEDAGTLDRDDIRDAIAATDMETVIGNVTFREDGTGVVPTVMLQYQEGEVQLIWPEEFATADLVYPAPAISDR
ncbi:MAG: amino acid ABC transporter substrate-binding protein [Chloroflexi bacterium]|nr:amino acid ABC transporter substrate-binding protein [Chloroflexota bacterium]